MLTTPTKDELKNAPVTFWSGLAFFVVVCVFLLVIANEIYVSMTEGESVPVSSLVINGNTPYTSKDEIVVALKQSSLNNFFKLDVNQVQKNLEELPWVYAASVRKQWPNEVSVYVIDQKPVAQWNDDFFINEHGVIFQADKTRVTHALPKLFGPEGSEVIALENYRNFTNLLTYVDVGVNELVLTERYSWQLILADGVSLNLGREDRIQRVQRFMDAYRQIKAFAQDDMQVDYIDLRYDTGMAVGWKPVINELEKQKEQKTNA